MASERVVDFYCGDCNKLLSSGNPHPMEPEARKALLARLRCSKCAEQTRVVERVHP